MKYPIVIGVNGPPGIGKTWFGERALAVIEGNRRLLGLREFIWMEVQQLYQWRGTYAEFKEHRFEDGATGRDALIAHADGRRKVDLHYWDRQMVESAAYLQSEVIVHDSLRKWEEHEWFQQHSSEFVTVVISPYHYSIGCLYEGDNGIRLPPTGGFNATDSNLAIARFKEFWPNRKARHASEISR